MTPEEQLKALREQIARTYPARYDGGTSIGWEAMTDYEKAISFEKADRLIREVLAPSGLGWQGPELSEKEKDVYLKNVDGRRRIFPNIQGLLEAARAKFIPIDVKEEKK